MVTWQAAPGAAEYQVTWTSASGSGSNPWQTATAARITGLAPDTYEFHVYARNANLEQSLASLPAFDTVP